MEGGSQDRWEVEPRSGGGEVIVMRGIGMAGRLIGDGVVGGWGGLSSGGAVGGLGLDAGGFGEGSCRRGHLGCLCDSSCKNLWSFSKSICWIASLPNKLTSPCERLRLLRAGLLFILVFDQSSSFDESAAVWGGWTI